MADLDTNLSIIEEFTQRLQTAVLGAEETTANHEYWVTGPEDGTIPTPQGQLKTLRGQIADWFAVANQTVSDAIVGFDNEFTQQLTAYDEEFSQYLLNIGFEPPVLYAAGLTVERISQTYVYNGVTYYWSGVLPHVTTGSFETEASWLIAPITGGIEIPAFTFATGGQLIRRTQTVLGVDGEWYYWTGNLPKTIPAASTVTTAGGVGQGLFKLAAGVFPVRPMLTILATATGNVLNSGSFEYGATVPTNNNLLAQLGTGRMYRWAGSLPKVVNINSTPENSGGISPSAWVLIDSAQGVDGSTIIQETPPTSPTRGMRWSRCSDMKSFIWYVDVDGGQWVEDNPSMGGIPIKHNDLLERDEAGAHDAIYRRASTVAEVASGVFEIGARLSLTDRADAPFNIEPVGSYVVNGFNILNAGVGKVAVLRQKGNRILLEQYGLQSGETSLIKSHNKLVIEAALEANGNNKIYDFGDEDWSFDMFKLNVIKAKLRAGGNLDGEVLIEHPTYLTENDLKMKFDITAINWVAKGVRRKAPIHLHYARRGKIIACDAENYESMIHVEEHGQSSDPAWGQPVNRIIVGMNSYDDCDHFITSVSSSANGITFNVADIIVAMNMGEANIRHLDIDTIDGLTLSSNIQFFSGSVAESAIKSHNNLISRGTWLNIHDNKFFEAGESGLVLDKCSRYNVHDNQYAYAGQRIESFALVIQGQPIAGDYFSQGSVHSETIIDPSGGGVVVGAKSGRLQLMNINTQSPAATSRYYGPTISSPNRKGLVINSDSVNVNTGGNMVRWGDNTLPQGVGQSNTHSNNISDTVGDGSGVQRNTSLKVLTLTGTETVIDVTNYDVINLSQSAATSITSVVNNSQAKEVLFKSFNSNSTFVHSTNLHLAGSVNVNLGIRDTLTLYCDTGTASVESGRSV